MCYFMTSALSLSLVIVSSVYAYICIYIYIYIYIYMYIYVSNRFGYHFFPLSLLLDKALFITNVPN